ncbi:MAG: hypothetical protein U5L07_07895 [Desulfobacterales bacterium]|nr:hypothetical protein [Desulfobacterales bacterium]
MGARKMETLGREFSRYVVPDEIKRWGDEMVACDRLSERYQKIFLGGKKALKLQIRRIAAERKFWEKALNYYPELKAYRELSYNPNSGCIEICCG